MKVFRLSKWCTWVFLPKDIALHHWEFTAQNFENVQLVSSGRAPLNMRLGGPHSWSVRFGEEENFYWLSWFSGLSCHHTMSLVTQPLKIKAICSLDVRKHCRNRQPHSRIPGPRTMIPWSPTLQPSPCANWAKPQVPNGYSSHTEWENGNVGWWRGVNVLTFSRLMTCMYVVPHC
jgi:hypothetical protein